MQEPFPFWFPWTDRRQICHSPLIEILDDKSPDMRVLSIYALEQPDAKEALPRIRALHGDNEKTHYDGLVPVTVVASEAIIKLKGRP